MQVERLKQHREWHKWDSMCSEACHLQQTCTPFTSDHSTHRPTRRPNNFNTLSLHSDGHTCLFVLNCTMRRRVITSSFRRRRTNTPLRCRLVRRISVECPAEKGSEQTSEWSWSSVRIFCFSTSRRRDSTLAPPTLSCHSYTGITPPFIVVPYVRNEIKLVTNCEFIPHKVNKNSSGDEIANANFLTTISHTRRPTSKYRKRDKPTLFNKLDDR